MPKYKIDKEEQKQVSRGKSQARPGNQEESRQNDKRAEAAGMPPLLLGNYSEGALLSAESHIKAINEGRMGVPDNYKEKKRNK